MNQIERLRDDLAKEFRGITMAIDAPAKEGGTWHLDIQREGGIDPIVVEWRRDRGFGVSTPDEDDFGTGPDEVFTNGKAALKRIAELITSGGHSRPPEAVRLAELRHLRGLSQEELANLAGMRQANLSRIECRDDILLSTLRKIVSAMDATLCIRAKFSDGVEREIRV